MSDFQMDMNLMDNGNRLKNAMEKGNFIFLAECAIPVNENRREAAAERILPLAEMMAKQEGLCGGLAISDLPGTPWSSVEIGSAFPEELRNNNLYFISGRSRTEEMIREQLSLASNSGIRNLVPVSGDIYPGTVRESRGMNFYGSLQQLLLINGMEKDFFTGCVSNPFHYDGHTMLASCGALAEKIDAGAQFVVTQSGWDMLQNQALAWYLFRGKRFLPLIARLTLLTPDRAEKILAGEVPGVRMTRAFAKLIQRELSAGKSQFEAAQYRRLELQSAGCRLMGYSGVQICGVDFPGKAALIASRIRSALQEFRSFEHFLDEYNAHQASAEMSLGINKFHLFDRMLYRQYPLDEPPVMNAPEDVDFSFHERLMFRLKKFLFAKSDRERAGRDRILKKLLADCRGCDKCTLPENEFLCIKNCPKKLLTGPCGGVREDGLCEIGSEECVFVKKVRSERFRKAVYGLES